MSRPRGHLVVVPRPDRRGGRIRPVIGWVLAAGSLGPRGLAGLAVLLLVCAAGYAALGCWPMAAVGVALALVEAFFAVRIQGRVRRGGGGEASC